MHIFKTNSVDETLKLGSKIAQSLNSGDVLGLKGNFGAGKTHLVKSICSFFDIHPSSVTSPSFTLVNEYYGTKHIAHIDTYRLKSDEEFELLDLEYYINQGAIILIEWAGMVEHLLPETAKIIEINILDETVREINISQNLRLAGEE